MLYPFWFMAAPRCGPDASTTPARGSLSSWHDLFAALPVLRELLNSTLITAGAIVLILAASTTAGYALGTLRYRFSSTVFS